VGKAPSSSATQRKPYRRPLASRPWRLVVCVDYPVANMHAMRKILQHENLDLLTRSLDSRTQTTSDLYRYGEKGRPRERPQQV
jgi:hypothetical protein